MFKKYIVILFFIVCILAGCNNKMVNQPIDRKLIKSEDDTIPILESNERLVLNNVSGGVAVLNENLEIVKQFTNATINSDVLIINKDQPFILQMSKVYREDKQSDNELFGVYLLSEDRWLIDPVFAGIGIVGSKYYSVDDGEYQPYIYDQNGELIADGEIYEVGDNYWISYGNKSKNAVYSSKGEVIKEWEETYYYLDFHGEYVKATIEGHNKIYDKNGMLLLDRDIIISKNPQLSNVDRDSIEVYNINSYGTLAYAEIGGRETILDKDSKIITKIGADEVPWFYMDTDFYGVKEQNEDIILYYDSESNPLATAEGNLYNNYGGLSYLAFIDDNGINIEDMNTKEKFYLNTPSSGEKQYISFNVIAPYLFSAFAEASIDYYHDDQLLVEGGYDLYYKEQLLMENCNGYAIMRNGYLLNINFSDRDKENYITHTNTIWNKNMEVIYESPCTEDILYIGENYVITNRGNFLCILDFNGNYLFKTLQAHMESD